MRYIRTRDLKEMAEKKLDSYDEAQPDDLLWMAEEDMKGSIPDVQLADLIGFARQELEGYEIDTIDEDDWQSILPVILPNASQSLKDLWLGIFQNFTPKDPDEWAFDEVESDMDSYYDSKYQECRDEGRC